LVFGLTDRLAGDPCVGIHSGDGLS
jgi:hypothetical protein